MPTTRSLHPSRSGRWALGPGCATATLPVQAGWTPPTLSPFHLRSGTSREPSWEPESLLVSFSTTHHSPPCKPPGPPPSALLHVPDPPAASLSSAPARSSPAPGLPYTESQAIFSINLTTPLSLSRKARHLLWIVSRTIFLSRGLAAQPPAIWLPPRGSGARPSCGDRSSALSLTGPLPPGPRASRSLLPCSNVLPSAAPSTCSHPVPGSVTIVLALPHVAQRLPSHV